MRLHHKNLKSQLATAEPSGSEVGLTLTMKSVIRAFVQMRAQIAASTDIFKRLAEMDRTLLSHDDALRAIWQKLQPLLAPPPAKPKPRIGFHP